MNRSNANGMPFAYEGVSAMTRRFLTMPLAAWHREQHCADLATCPTYAEERNVEARWRAGLTPEEREALAAAEARTAVTR